MPLVSHVRAFRLHSDVFVTLAVAVAAVASFLTALLPGF